jgi:RHS repeat-associated protein
MNTTQTQAPFVGEAGESYFFQVKATDNVNNASAWVEAGPVTVSAVTKYYYHGGQRIAMRQGDVVYYLHSDHLGSTSLTTDNSGTVVAETRYLPYGEERWASGGAVSDYTYTGQRAEAGFRLMDYNARYYDPRLGRFISPDSIVPNPRNPQDLNRYSYVRSNPLRHTDPSGQVLCGGVNECSGGGYQAYSYYMSVQDTQTAVENAGKVVQAGAVGVLTLLGADFISDAADTVTYAASGQWGNAAISGLAAVVPLVPGSVARAGKGLLKHADEVADTARAAKSLVGLGIHSDEATDLVRILAESSTRNGRIQGGVTLLGSFPEYIDMAKLEGITYFDMSGETWRVLSEAGEEYIWAVNKQFLDDSIAAGHSFAVTLGEGRTPGKYLQREIEYLVENGYELVNGIYVRQ